ncbi:hypothetical protein [Kribbella capetownensis]|uniref:hypothetical protein n=1 Tax=Kribbella capetownensis TaxID=1572659 RepID=UPI0013F3ACEE|nr:hypothetical protein [Kribbella capetownensis]
MTVADAAQPITLHRRYVRKVGVITGFRAAVDLPDLGRAAQAMVIARGPQMD